MTAISDLVLRLESAHGPDGELDAMIWIAVDRRSAQVCFSNAAPGLPKPIPDVLPLGLGRNAVIANAPHYTGDMNAALSLLPWSEHPGATFTLKLIQGGVKQFYCTAEFTWPSTEIQDRARTPELVVCLVALRAIERTREELAPYRKVPAP